MMDYKKLNELLSDLGKLGRKSPVEEETLDYSKVVVVSAESVEEGLYLRLEYETDSYGEGDRLISLRFVRPTEVKVTNFIDA
jgi:hypothetical protein